MSNFAQQRPVRPRLQPEPNSPTPKRPSEAMTPALIQKWTPAWQTCAFPGLSVELCFVQLVSTTRCVSTFSCLPTPGAESNSSCQTTLFKQAIELGAQPYSDLTDKVTHLLAVEPGSAKYKVCWKLCMSLNTDHAACSARWNTISTSCTRLGYRTAIKSG